MPPRLNICILVLAAAGALLATPAVARNKEDKDQAEADDNALSIARRKWTLGLSLGAAQAAPRAPWRKALLPQYVEETAVGISYRLNCNWDIWGQWSARSHERNLDDDLRLQYDATSLLAGVSRQVTPWSYKPSAWWGRIQLALIGAAGYSETAYRLSDGYARVKGHSRSPALAAGAHIRVPVRDDFWITLRDIGRVERLEVQDLGARGFVLFNSTLLGADYAF